MSLAVQSKGERRVRLWGISGWAGRNLGSVFGSVGQPLGEDLGKECACNAAADPNGRGTGPLGPVPQAESRIA